MAYNIARIHEHIVNMVAESNATHLALVEEFGARDAENKLVPHDSEPGTFTIPEEKKAEWVPKYSAFLATAVEIKRPRIELEKVEVAELTPAEISSLLPLLSVPAEQDAD